MASCPPMGPAPGTWLRSRSIPRALCGDLVLYGARLQPWADVPNEARCGLCLGRMGPQEGATL